MFNPFTEHRDNEMPNSTPNAAKRKPKKPKPSALPREIHPEVLYRSSELTRFGLSHATRWRLNREHEIKLKGIRSGGSMFYEGSEIIRVLKERSRIQSA